MIHCGQPTVGQAVAWPKFLDDLRIDR